MTTVIISAPSNPVVRVSASSEVFAVEPYTFGFDGVLLAPVIGNGILYLEGPYSVESLRFTLGTASLSGSVVFDVKCNDVSICSTPPTLTAGETTLLATSLLNKTTFTTGDRLTVDIISAGLSQTAADLTVTLRLKRRF